METAEDRVIIYRKSRHFDEEPLMVDEQSARASISAWKRNVDDAIKILREGGKVATPNFYFYGVPA